MSSSEGDQFVSESNFEELVALAKCLDCVWTENFHPCDCKFRKTPEGKARCEQLRAEQEKRNATDRCQKISGQGSSSTSGSGQPSKPSEQKDSTGNASKEPTSSRKQSSEPETSNNQNGSAERENTPRGSGEKENPNHQTEFAQPMTSTVDSQGQSLEPGANRDSLKGDAGDPETGRSSNDQTIPDSENPDTPNSPRNSGNQDAPNSDIKTDNNEATSSIENSTQNSARNSENQESQEPRLGSQVSKNPESGQTLLETRKIQIGPGFAPINRIWFKTLPEKLSRIQIAQGLPRTPNLVQTLPETLKTKMTPNLEIQIHPGILILRRNSPETKQIRRETPKMQTHQQIQSRVTKFKSSPSKSKKNSVTVGHQVPLPVEKNRLTHQIKRLCSEFQKHSFLKGHHSRISSQAHLKKDRDSLQGSKKSIASKSFRRNPHSKTNLSKLKVEIIQRKVQQAPKLHEEPSTSANSNPKRESEPQQASQSPLPVLDNEHSLNPRKTRKAFLTDHLEARKSEEFFLIKQRPPFSSFKCRDSKGRDSNNKTTWRRKRSCWKKCRGTCSEPRRASEEPQQKPNEPPQQAINEPLWRQFINLQISQF
ncbi:hypothetical protein Ocin01_19572 [Orchesella cincta]|uniref:Uncharacterized protein n=1 Tax=Orchesella cincta TaxID=48709 RepID=A0A1D2M2B4_ORCCI|nr:hypothetical protein Ocin01_19572 [Orchesella cincta]